MKYQYVKQFIKSIFLIDVLKSILLVFRYMFRRSVTINYPYEKSKVSFRFKGEHALRRYPNGEERCISCKLCEVICPAQVIMIEGGKIEDGTRKAFRYDLDLSRCIFCGLCEEACPVDAIMQTPNVEYATETKEELYYNKEKLLSVGDTWENYLSLKTENLVPYK